MAYCCPVLHLRRSFAIGLTPTFTNYCWKKKNPLLPSWSVCWFVEGKRYHLHGGPWASSRTLHTQQSTPWLVAAPLWATCDICLWDESSNLWRWAYHYCKHNWIHSLQIASTGSLTQWSTQLAYYTMHPLPVQCHPHWFDPTTRWKMMSATILASGLNYVCLQWSFW